MSAYDDGYAVGQVKRDDPSYDARWDFVGAAATYGGDFAEFKRGFQDGLNSAQEEDPCCLMYRQTYLVDHEPDCPRRVKS